MLRIAFKEWAVICRALAEGRQALILRKGGIAENGGVFQVEHTRFWLYPTYAHQQRDGVKPEALPLLNEVERQRPEEGVLRLGHFAEVADVHRVADLDTLLALDGLHLWSEATVRSRFAYRQFGLFVLAVRVFAVSPVQELPETPKYAGCRSWVELDQELSIDGASPVLDDAAFQARLTALRGISSAAGASSCSAGRDGAGS
jgi:hypothetical protein